MLRNFFVLSLLFFVLPVSAQDTLDIYFTGEINGVIKSEVPSLHGDILRVEAAMKDHLAKAGRSADEVLLFDTGDAIGDHYLSQLDSGRTMVRQMIEVGYDGITVSGRDLIYGADHLGELFGEEGALPLITTNLFRGDTTLFTPYQIYQRRGWTIGVVGVDEEGGGDQSIRERQQNVDFVSPVKALQRMVDSLKQRCDFIIAVNHLNLDENLDIAQEVPEIDLFIGKHSNDSLRYLELYNGSEGPRTHIISAPKNALGIGHLQVVMQEGGRRSIQVQPVIPVGSRTFEGVPMGDYESLDSTFIDYVKRTYDVENPDLPLVEIGESAQDDMLNYALFVMLKSTRSELAILNYGFLLSPLFSSKKDTLTIRDVASLTRMYDPLVTLRLKGSQLKKIIGRSKQFGARADERLHFLAVGDYEQNISELKPHGLAINDDQVYAVVTTHYLAEGGDGYQTFLDGTHRRDYFTGRLRLLAKPYPEGERIHLSKVKIGYLLSGQHPGDVNNELDFFRQDDFLNKPLVLLNFQNIDFSFKSVRVYNNEDFTTANDKRVSASTQNATNITSSGYISLTRRSEKTRWENGALFRYGLQRIGANEAQESDDRLELQTILDWDNPFNIFGGKGKFSLFGSIRYDTEFTSPEDAEGNRLPRRKDGYLYLGISNFGKQNREARLAFFTKEDFVNKDRDMGLELNVKYFKDFPSFKHGSILRARYHFQQPNRMLGDEQALVDYTGYLDIGIIQFIHLKPQINLFLFRDMVLRKWATNVQFSIGLSFSRLWKPQYIRFWRSNK